MNRAKMLLVEDDPALAELVSWNFRREDFEALKAQVAALSAELAALKSPAAPVEPAAKAAPKSRKTGQ